MDTGKEYGCGPPEETIPIDKWGISVTPEITALLEKDAPVAFGVSGGKDSSAVAIIGMEYLDKIGHHGPRLLIHSDLGTIEWKESLPTCQKHASRLNLELVVVRRKAGGLIHRWETRWKANVRRYLDLSCVKLILPFSTPAMRFCTSECKTGLISSKLKSLFPNNSIISITGVRGAESASRAKMSISSLQPKLTRRGLEGYDWRPIFHWSTPDVFAFLEAKGEALHEAYTRYGCSRLSCSYCIMSSLPDLKAAASCVDNHIAYRRLVDLEVQSSFAFQGNRWLGDIDPQILDPITQEALREAKERARLRVEAEALIPKHMLFASGWPQCIPSLEEAKILGSVRQRVCEAVGLPATYTSPEEIIVRYQQLYDMRYGGTGNLFDVEQLAA